MSVHEKVFTYLTEDAVVGCLQTLVRTPSENPPADYSKIVPVLKRKMEEAGLQVEVIGKPDKPNVIGTLKGSVGKPKVVYYTHLDTVPAGDKSKWTFDPFGGVVKDGKVFGRGSCDAKAPASAFIMAAKAIHDAGIKLKGDMIIALMCDEETGWKDGLWYLVDKGFFDNKDVLVAAGTTTFAYSVASRGVFWVELTTHGPGSHTMAYSSRKKPINTLYKMVDILKAIQNVDDWMTYEPLPIFTPEKGNTYTGKPIMEPNVIEASSKVNIIPETCKVQIDMRILPTQTCEGVQKDLENVIKKLKDKDPELDADIKVIQATNGRFIQHDPRDIELMRKVAKILNQELKEMVHGATLGNSAEQERLVKGKRRINLGTMTSEILSGHSVDEHQLISNLMLATKASILYALDLCEIDKNS